MWEEEYVHHFNDTNDYLLLHDKFFTFYADKNFSST